MGLNIVGNVVTVDHTHNRLLNTQLSSNPVTRTLDSGLVVHEVFQRQRTPRSAGRQQKGDNCPLLYALKQKDGLLTTRESIESLIPNFKGILQKLPIQPQLIVCAPSAFPIAKIVAKRIAGYAPGSVLAPDVFEKVKIAAVLTNLPRLPLNRDDKKSLESRLKRLLKEGASDLSLKDIPTQFREHFPPLRLRKNNILGNLTNVTEIVVVDDLLSTGTTLDCAVSLLNQVFTSANFTGVCLFGQVHT